MAAVLRIFRSNIPQFSHYFIKKNSPNGIIPSTIRRFMFSDNTLGIPNYNNTRLNVQQQFASVENSFRQKMKEIITNENSVIFSEDLKVMLHLVTKESEDINLVLEMIRRFNNQNKELRFGTFIFGPVIMRTFYYLDEPDIAFNVFTDSKLQNLFDQVISYTILLTLLYKHKKYSEMKQVYDIIKVRSVDIVHFPINALIVIMAGCHDENTPESYKYALENWKILTQKGIRHTRRVVTFLANLALKQNCPEMALEILLGSIKSGYIDNRCLKVLAFCHLKRLVDIITMFRQAVEHTERKENYFSDVIEAVEEVAMNEKDEHLKNEVLHLISIMKAEGLVEKMTLQTHLLTPIDTNFNRRRSRTDQLFNRSDNSEKKTKFGLKDLL